MKRARGLGFGSVWAQSPARHIPIHARIQLKDFRTPKFRPEAPYTIDVAICSLLISSHGGVKQGRLEGITHPLIFRGIHYRTIGRIVARHAHLLDKEESHLSMPKMRRVRGPSMQHCHPEVLHYFFLHCCHLHS